LRSQTSLSGYGPELSDAAIDALWIGFEREHRLWRNTSTATVTVRFTVTAAVQLLLRSGFFVLPGSVRSDGKRWRWCDDVPEDCSAFGYSQ
jgi:hypothetical protein